MVARLTEGDWFFSCGHNKPNEDHGDICGDYALRGGGGSHVLPHDIRIHCANSHIQRNASDDGVNCARPESQKAVPAGLGPEVGSNSARFH